MSLDSVHDLSFGIMELLHRLKGFCWATLWNSQGSCKHSRKPLPVLLFGIHRKRNSVLLPNFLEDLHRISTLETTRPYQILFTYSLCVPDNHATFLVQRT